MLTDLLDPLLGLLPDASSLGAMGLQQQFEYAASGLSIVGAELLSRKTRHAPWGWFVWLLANMAFITFAVLGGHWGILVMQIWFMKTNLCGISNHLLPILRHEKA